jgi:hypothetical protein
MSDRDPVGSVSGNKREGRRRGLGWLWLLLPALLLLGLVAYALLANVADGDDAEGVDLTFGDCPSYAGPEGEDETAELASEPGRFEGCDVDIIAPVAEVVDENVVVLQGPETEDQPIILVRGEGDEPLDLEVGDPLELQGTARASLDPAALAEDLGGDEAAYEDLDGEPYVRLKRLSAADSTSG